MRYTFKVYERLKKEQHIDTLFQVGKAFSVFPLRAVYVIKKKAVENESPVMTGFSVPKKKFPSSVGRHRVRRLMVEAWRLHKHDLYAIIPSGIQIHMFFLFTDKKLPQYQDVEQAIIKCIEKLKDLPLTEKEESKNIKNIGPA